MKEQTESKVPRIRFKGFDGEWVEQFLGEVFTKIRNAFVGTATPYYTQKGHFYLQSNNIKNGKINRNTEVFINEDFYLKQKDNWLRSNDIVMVQSGHVGHTAVIPDELNNSAAHALIIISRPLRDTCPHYLNFYLQGNRARRDLANITTGNTIKHILASDIKKFGAFFTHYEEQTQIGEYFRELDSLIGLHQRKHDKLVMLKKAMLQKMFPQAGVTTPEIRFKGFEGKWEEKTLGQIANVYQPQTISQRDLTATGFDVYGANGIIGKYSKYNHKEPQIAVTCRGNTCGTVNFTKEKSWITGNAMAVNIDENTLINKQFLFQQLSSQDFNYLISGSGQPQITGVIKLHKTWISHPIEQQKIGTYFRQLDELISKHAIQLQKLKQIKSACLEKMFV